MAGQTIDYDALAKQHGAVSSEIDYDALAKQHGAISSTAPNAPSAPTPTQGSAASRFGSGLWSTTGGGILGTLKALAALTVEGGKAIGGQFDPNSPGGQAVMGIVQSHIDQAEKAKAAIQQGRYSEAAGHTLATILPLVGPAAAHAGERIGEGDVAGGLGEATGLVATSAAPMLREVPAVQRAGAAIESAAETATAAARGAAKGAAQAATETVPLKKLGVEISVPKPLVTGTATSIALQRAGVPHQVGFAIGASAPIIKGAIRGARAELAARAATEAAAPAEVIPPGRQIGTGSIVTPPPADTSYVRGVPAEVQPIPESRQLAAPATIVTPAPADTSYVRAVPAQYPEVIPPELRGGVPPVATPATPAALALREAMVNMQERRAAAAVPEAAQTLEAAMRVDHLSDYLKRNNIPGDMIAQFGPKEWKIVADYAGVQPPDAAQIDAIRKNIAGFEAAATMPPSTGKLSPAEARADFENRLATRAGETAFQEQKARIEEGMTPPETPPAAGPAPAAPTGGAVLPEGSMAVPEGSAVLEPLPEGTPAHYQEVQVREGTSNALRAFAKDQRIAQYVLSKGISPDEFAAMPLDQQNKLVVEAPTASGKGRHRPFVEPKPGQSQTMGRWAQEGIRHVTETMRWIEGRKIAAAAKETP